MKRFTSVLPSLNFTTPSRIPRLIERRSIALKLQNNSHLIAFVPEMQNFLDSLGMNFDANSISNVLVDSFDAKEVSSDNRMLRLANLIEVSLETVVNMIVQLDPYGICSAVQAAVVDLGADAVDESIYVGITTVSFRQRLKCHFQLHDTLTGGVLCEFSDFSSASFAETAGILMAQKLSKNGTVKSCWNVESGYGSPACIKAGAEAVVTSVYFLHTSMPFTKTSARTGLLKRKVIPDVRDDGKFYSTSVTIKNSSAITLLTVVLISRAQNVRRFLNLKCCLLKLKLPHIQASSTTI